MQRTVFDEAVTAAEKKHASTEADEQWLSANREILLENQTVHAMQLVDHMIMSSGGQFLSPADDRYQLIITEETPRRKLQSLLDILTPTPAVNNVPLFKQALSHVYPNVFESCINVESAMVSMRSDLDEYYNDQYNTAKPLAWLDDQAETATTYIPNTCLIGKSEAEKMISRNATSAAEQERRDYLYAKPAKEKIVRFDYLYQNPDAANQQITTSSTEVLSIAVSTGSVSLPHSPRSPSPALSTDNDSSFRSKLAHAKRVGIYAGAGCGKTFCCIHVATSYLQHWSMFDVVLFWHLRDPTVQEAETLEELLCALGPSWTTIRAKRHRSV